jgi:predicted N-acetyltransferase YhbS
MDQVISTQEENMPVREISAAGIDAVELATELLQRARQADPRVGLWEAADIQWWWRSRRLSDDVEKVFWVDADGPVAGVLLTSWTDDDWQCDPVIVPGIGYPSPETMWSRAMELAADNTDSAFEVPIAGDDRTFQHLALQSGLTAGDQDFTAWMDVADRPAIVSTADGFTIVDRTQRLNCPHHMRHRSGERVEQRLKQCSLYDPELDLAVEADDGVVAGYALFWFDPITKVGLIEPVRVEDAFQRQGLARAMLTEGIARLARRGAQRIKVSYQTEAAAALYQSVGFDPDSTTTWYRATGDHSRSSE